MTTAINNKFAFDTKMKKNFWHSLSALAYAGWILDKAFIIYSYLSIDLSNCSNIIYIFLYSYDYLRKEM